MAVTLASDALTTLDAVKDELAITVSTYDDYLTRQINAASARIVKYCYRAFAYEEDIEETFAAEGQMRFLLSRAPIASISSITYDSDTVSSGDYEIEDSTLGSVRMLPHAYSGRYAIPNISYDSAPGTARKLYTVTYTGGYALPAAATPTLPADIEQACILLAAMAYNQRGKDRSVSAESLLGWSATYGGLIGAGGMPATIEALLQPYKRIYT